MRVGGLSDPGQPDHWSTKLFGLLLGHEDDGGPTVGDRTGVEEPERLGHVRVVRHRLRRIEDALHRYLLLQVRPLVVEGGVLVLDADHGEMPLGHAVLLHVKAGEHSGLGRESHPVDVLGKRMGKGGNEVGGFEVVHLPHPFYPGHQHDVVHPGRNSLEPGLDSGGPRGGAVLDGSGSRRQQAQAVG